MPIDDKLVDRVRELIAATESNVEEKRMFGGLCFMVNDKMCVCARRNGGLMVRFDPELSDTIMKKEGCTPMVHSGKIMNGFVFVDPDLLKTKKQLDYWVGIAVDFNRFAKSSKKKKN